MAKAQRERSTPPLAPGGQQAKLEGIQHQVQKQRLWAVSALRTAVWVERTQGLGDSGCQGCDQHWLQEGVSTAQVAQGKSPGPPHHLYKKT